MPDKQLYANNAETTLNGPITNVATSITVTDGSIFPTILAPSAGLQSEYVLASIEDEIIQVTAVSGNVLTAVRGYEGTTNVAHDDTTAVDIRVTEDTLASFVKMDNDGDRKGNNSVNIQPTRDASTQVASGDGAVAIGEASEASEDENTAVGFNAWATSASSVAYGADTYAQGLAVAVAWSSVADVANGDVYEIDSNWGYQIGGDFKNTDTTEPTGTTIGDFVTDSTALWYMFEDTAGNNNSNIAIGGKTVGGDSVVIGKSGSVVGNGHNAIGYNNTSVGQDNVVLGTGNTVFGRGNTVIGAHGKDYLINDREVVNATSIGDAVDFSISYACRIVGPDYMPLEDGTFTAATTAPSYATTSVKEQIFYSAPIQAGVKAWAGTTSYDHGETVTNTTPDRYSYFARVTGSNGHYGSATSGSGEPTWPTTAGATVADGSITWVCVDTKDIRCYLPDNTRLLPTGVGFMADEHSGAPTAQPFLSFGIVANEDLWLLSTQTTMLTGAYAIQDYTNGDLETTALGSKALAADVVTRGTVNSVSGRLFWRGIVVESMTS